MGSNRPDNNMDVEDMKRILVYFNMAEEMSDLTLTKGVTVKRKMRDVRSKVTNLNGFNHVLAESAKKYPRCKKFCGKSEGQRALIQQWLQYCIVNLRGRSAFSEYVLKEMDASLAFTTFFGGHSLSLVDPVLYLTLHPIFQEMTFFEKEKYVNLSRWFRLVQEDENLRKGNKKVVFSKTSLYGSLYAHA